MERNQLTMAYDALWLVIFQFGAVFVCYHSSKFACKVMMQRMGFALPMALSVPVTVLLLSTNCRMRQKDSCYGTNVLTVVSAIGYKYELWIQFPGAFLAM